MATSNTSNCRPCEALNKLTLANYWCIECHDILCEDCNGHHSVAKSSNTHTVISIENYRKLPESVLNISPLCKDHGMKYYHFCTGHEAPCCPECAQSTHKSCPKLQLLDEAIKTAKTASLIDEVEKSMKEITSNLEKIISERGQNISGLQKQKREIKEKIGTARKNVNQHFDTLEEKMLRELNSIEESQTKKLQESLANLTAKLDMVKNKLEETTILKQYASDLQTFLGTRELEKVIEKEKTCIEHLLKDGSLNIYELQCSINDKIQSITSDIQTFGSVSVISKPSAVRLTSDKDKQAQLFLSSYQPNKIKFQDAITNIKIKFNIQGSKLRGCSVFPNDKVVVADSGNSRVIILTKSGIKEKEIPIRGGYEDPRDVTVIDDRTIAVSTDKGVQIIDVNTDTIDKTFDVGWCDGLSYQDGVLYICGNKGTKDIISIVMSSGIQKTIIRDNHYHYSYCTEAGDQLYYTRADKRGLQCYSIKGEKMWEYEDRTLINGPLGVTVDGSGNVYLTSLHNNKILMISPDGKRCRPILSENEGIIRPWGLCFNKNKNQLCVACAQGRCFVYEIN